MSSRLLNVRLDSQRLDKARSLRAHGIVLSDLVRDAIDREYEQVMKSAKRRSARAIMQEIYEQYPDPQRVAPRKYDVHDRHAARKAILRKLRKKR